MKRRSMLCAAALVGVCISTRFTLLFAASPGYTVHGLPLVGDRIPIGGVGIRYSGQITGHTGCSTSCYSHVFLDRMDLILPGSTFSFVYDINNMGQVVGLSGRDGGPVHAFVYDPSNGMTNLSPLVGGPSDAYGINNHGHIVGSASINDRFHAFRLRDGELTLFDTVRPAKKINDSGLIAGFGIVIEDDVIKPMLFPGGGFSDAYGINNLGQVVGQADNSNGRSRFSV